MHISKTDRMCTETYVISYPVPAAGLSRQNVATLPTLVPQYRGIRKRGVAPYHIMSYKNGHTDQIRIGGHGTSYSTDPCTRIPAPSQRDAANNAENYA